MICWRVFSRMSRGSRVDIEYSIIAAEDNNAVAHVVKNVFVSNRVDVEQAMPKNADRKQNHENRKAERRVVITGELAR